MKTFRIHLKNGNSFSVKAHHFTYKPAPGVYDPLQFYKDESTVDETILVMAGEVAAIVEQEPGVAGAAQYLPGTTGHRSY